jgi:hypothetical protein
MSLVFKAKIKDSYADLMPDPIEVPIITKKNCTEGVLTKSMIAKKPRTNGKPFGPVEIYDLVFLRAINMSYNDIAKRLHRSPATLSWMVCSKGLASEIEELRNHIIAVQMGVGRYEQNKEEAKDGR